MNNLFPFFLNVVGLGQPLPRAEVQKSADDLNSSIYLSIAILIFGAFIILLIFINLFIRKQGIGNNAIKLLGIVLVIIASIFVVVAGYSQDQITPIIGLLGTIVGYIIGAKGNGNGQEG